MINKENLKHWKTFAESLAKEIQEFESQQAAPVDDWPMTVEDLPKNENFWFVKDGEAEMNDGEYPNDIGNFDTEKDAKSALAFAQLSRLIRHVNKGWKPDFTNPNQSKFTVVFDYDNLTKETRFTYCLSPKCLYFKMEDDRDKSLETHRALWLDYFQADEQK